MPRSAALILSGGLALGAWQAGALSALERSGLLYVRAIAGSSIGALNGAIFAAAEPGARERDLRAFWNDAEHEPDVTPWFDPLGWTARGPARQMRNWLGVLVSRTAGVRGLFHLSPSRGLIGESLYDNHEVVATLERLIDFDRLTEAAMRFCVAATDIETGEAIFFDTVAGDRITPAHLRASSGLIPSFEPVRIGRRLLGDGGFSANAPLEPFLSSDRRGELPPLCILLDLFAPDAAPPSGLLAAAERGSDLKFACQTLLRLEGLRRERALAARLDPTAPGTHLLYLSYRSRSEEAGPEKTWDFSRPTLADRFRAGEAEARAALAVIPTLDPQPAPGLHIHQIRDVRVDGLAVA